MNKRIVFIDYIRVIACFLVMLVHSSENFYCWTADTSMLANESNRLWMQSDTAHLPDNPLYSHPHIFMLRNHHQGNKHYSWQQMDNRIGKGNWIRVSATMVEDNRVEAKKAMLDDYPSLRAMYDENDENTAVWYMTNAKASICSFTSAPKEICF